MPRPRKERTEGMRYYVTVQYEVELNITDSGRLIYGLDDPLALIESDAQNAISGHTTIQPIDVPDVTVILGDDDDEQLD